MCPSQEYEYMARRYHWGTLFSGFRDSRDGCDLGQFSRMLADPEGLCFCDEGALQVASLVEARAGQGSKGEMIMSMPDFAKPWFNDDYGLISTIPRWSSH